MKTNDKQISDFDFSFSYDKNLTEKPNNPESFYNGTLQLIKEARSEKDKLKKARLFSKTGAYFRISGDNVNAEKYLLRALKLIDKDKNKPEYLVATLRLAHTYQKQKRYGLSIKLFNEIEKLANSEDDLIEYRYFVYQHVGKLNFDMKKYKEALVFFKKALIFRKIKGDKELIDSTNLAIQITMSKLKEKK